MWRVLLAPVLAALLSGCQDQQARADNARLEARVAALEAQVKALTATRPDAASTGDADAVVMQAAGQHCANDLARFLETYRRDAGTYPAAREVLLPGSCLDLRVGWRALSPRTYAFSVSDGEGRLLAEGSGP